MNEEATPLSNELESTILDGRYRLVRPLAKVTSGGYVFAAEHVFTRKVCAVKVLERVAPEKAKRRMRREMDALAAVQGPGVVDFRDAGEADGRLYLVLELLEGRTLGGLLAAKGTLRVEQAVKLGAELATVLSRCHERGVIHRDIKPANVFVTADERVQLLDFGIAKIVDHERKLEKLTQENTLLGTPEYMAPEALLSSPDVDASADQYALGVTLYECLAGVVPFEGAYGEVLLKVSTTPLRPLRETRPDVPRVLDDLLARALRRLPSDRFSSIAEMGDALSSVGLGAAAAPMFEHHPPRLGHDSPTPADAPIARARVGPSRRRHPRAPYVTFARVRVAGTEHVDGRIEEISESGFQFVGTRAIPNGTAVAVRFALPVSGRLIEAPATVRWSHSRRDLTAVGLEFASLPKDAIGEVRKYVSLLRTD